MNDRNKKKLKKSLDFCFIFFNTVKYLFQKNKNNKMNNKVNIYLEIFNLKYIFFDIQFIEFNFIS